MANVTDKARIEFHLPAELKPMVEQAAALRGQSVSEFALATVADNAQRVVQQYHVTNLSNRDRDLFLAMLDDENAQPSDALVASAERYKKWARHNEP
ncbi:MAG: DUF1778 domain-containing protein [Candidatus Saccharimonadales bacterium]